MKTQKALKKIFYEKVKCTSCNGTGFLGWNECSNTYNICNSCENTGYVYYDRKNHVTKTEFSMLTN
jgi:DnaJ-class molecular chaperone